MTTPLQFTEGYNAYESGAECPYDEASPEADLFWLGVAQAEMEWTEQQNEIRRRRSK